MNIIVFPIGLVVAFGVYWSIKFPKSVLLLRRPIIAGGVAIFVMSIITLTVIAGSVIFNFAQHFTDVKMGREDYGVLAVFVACGVLLAIRPPARK